MPEVQVDFSPFNVMVIDDSKSMLELLATVLRAFGIGQVFQVEDPAAAREHLAHKAVDCILMDWVMKPVSGLTLVEQIRHDNWEVNRQIPIIMCSAHTDLAHLRKAMEAGVDEVLTKPVTVSDVFDKLYSALFQRRPFIISETYVGPKLRSKFWEEQDKSFASDVIDYTQDAADDMDLDFVQL